MSPVGIKVYDITSFSIQIWHDMVLYHCNITLLDMWEKTEAIFCQSPISRPPPIYSVGRNAPARVNRSNVLVQRTVRWRTIFISFIIFIFIILTCILLVQLSVFIIIFGVPFSTQPSPILLHSSLLYSLKELDFETLTLLCIEMVVVQKIVFWSSQRNQLN